MPTTPRCSASLKCAACRSISAPKGLNAAAQVREQLSNLYRSILASGRSVQIRTFHSWFAALLRSAPVAVLQRLELPVNYELLEDDAPARALVWRRFYAAVAADAALKADFESVVLAHGRFQTDKALQAALDKRTEFTLADEKGVIAVSVQPFAAQFTEFGGLDEPEELLSTNRFHRQSLERRRHRAGPRQRADFFSQGRRAGTGADRGRHPGGHGGPC
jgi:ATP-dependent helicase/nuclease subunit A